MCICGLMATNTSLQIVEAAPTVQANILQMITDQSTLNRSITREDFFALITKEIYGVQTEIGELPFEDIGDISVHLQPYLSKAYESNIFSGSKENDLLYANPKSYITRQDACVVIARVLSKQSKEPLDFLDTEEISSYAQESISGLLPLGIVPYYQNNMFEPKKLLTYTQAYQMMEYILQYVKFSENTVSTYAGTGNKNLKDGLSSQADFSRPNGLTMDKEGVLYVMDSENNAIRTIANGQVKTYAGTTIYETITGVAKGAFADGENQKAFFDTPLHATFTKEGELLVSDSENHVLRQVSNTNTTTYAGSLTAGYQNGTQEATQFYLPTDMTTDLEGNIYICDTLNHVIRVIDTDGKASLFAGTPQKSGYYDGIATQALFNEPSGIAVATDGTVYVSDSGNQRIRMIKNGVVSTIAGSGSDKLAQTDYILGGYQDGTTSIAKFDFPLGIDLLDDTRLIVADSQNHVIRMIDLLNKNVFTIAGAGSGGTLDGKAFESYFNKPTDVLYHNGNIYIADSLSNKIRILNFK